MKEIILTQGYVTFVDDEDYDWLSQWSWCISKDLYAMRSKRWDGKNHSIRMHRFIMGVPSGLEVDHINGNRLDNRRCNLRVCTRSENSKNLSSVIGKSGYKGVHFEYKSWRSRITVNGKKLHLGRFETAEEAAKAYDEAARRYFGEYAKTNF